MSKPILLGTALAALVAARAASAAEIDVLTAGAVQEAEKTLAAGYEKATGNHVNFTAGTVGQIQAKLRAGASADVIVVSATAMAGLEKSGAVSGRATPLGRIGIGVGMKDGAPAPDISTPEKFKEAMLAAKSITYMDPAEGASSGIATARVMKTLGIAEEIAHKTKLTERGYSADRVASGEVQYAIQNMSEIVPVRGVKLVGPLPAPLQTYTAYSAAVSTTAAHGKEAADLIRYLTRPQAANQWKAAGIQPVP
jgi:molybdate transport system substrate-binding protein